MFKASGMGLVSLGPLPSKKASYLVATVAGTTVDGFDDAFAHMHSHLFDTNVWQHRLPDFLVSSRRAPGLRGVKAAGYW